MPKEQHRGFSGDFQTRREASSYALRGFAAPAALLAGTLGLASPAFGASSQPAVCETSFDPYEASPEIRQACGIKSFPRKDKITHPDGATEYTYLVNGNEVAFLLPPSGFDATKASPSELARYGVPPKPPASDVATRTAWEYVIHNFNPVKPPAELLQIPARAAEIESENWSGYVDYGTFVTSEVRYVEPRDHGPGSGAPCADDAAVFWTGLGGVQTDDLAQNGTGITTPSLGEHQAWWEILPAPITPIPFYATESQLFKAGVNRPGNYFSFYWYNFATSQGTHLTVQSNRYDGRTAEFIAERPTLDFGGPSERFASLANFGRWDVEYAHPNGNPQQNYPNDSVNMWTANRHWLAAPSAIVNADGGFSDKWKNCN